MTVHLLRLILHHRCFCLLLFAYREDGPLLVGQSTGTAAADVGSSAVHHATFSQEPASQSSCRVFVPCATINISAIAQAVALHMVVLTQWCWIIGDSLSLSWQDSPRAHMQSSSVWDWSSCSALSAQGDDVATKVWFVCAGNTLPHIVYMHCIAALCRRLWKE